MSNYENVTVGKCKKFASKVDGFDHSGFVTRSSAPTQLNTAKTCTMAGLRREMTKMGLKSTGRVSIRTKLGNRLEVK